MALDGLGGALAKTGVQVVLDSDPVGIIKGFAQAETAGQKFAATLGGISNVAKATYGGLQRVAAGFEQTAKRVRNAGIGLGLSLLGATYGAMQLESSMHNLATIDENVRNGFHQSTQTVINMSRVLPASAKEIADGWYEIASSGFYGAEGTTVLNSAIKAGVAGLSTTAEAGMALTAVLNAYGLTAAQATKISDLMFQTVNLGVLHFSDLTGVVGDSVGLAAAAGVGFKEVGTAIATMTLSGISASEAGTSLNRLVQSLIDPSEELAYAWTKISIIPLAQALKDTSQGGLGLHGVMELLRQASGGNVEILKQWFDEIRAARGAFALMGADGDTYQRVFKGMGEATNGAGQTQKAFEEQMKSTSMQLKLLVNEVKSIGIELGNALLPFANAAIKTANMFIGAWNVVPEPLKKVVAWLSALSSVFLTVTGVLAVFVARSLATLVVTRLIGTALQNSGAAVSRWGLGWERAGTQIAAAGTRVQGMGRSFNLLSPITGTLNVLGMGVQQLGLHVATAHPKVEAFGLGIGRMGDFMRTAASSVQTLAVALPLLLTGLLLVGSAMNTAEQNAEQMATTINSRFNSNTFEGVNKGIDMWQKKFNELDDNWDKWHINKEEGWINIHNNVRTLTASVRGLGSQITTTFGAGHVFGDPFGDAAARKKAIENLIDLQVKYSNTLHASNRVQNELSYRSPGLYDQIHAGTQAEQAQKQIGYYNLTAKAAKNLGINLQDAMTLGRVKTAALTDEVERLASKAGMTPDQAAQFGKGVKESLDAAQKAIKEFIKAGQEAFMKGFDIAGAVEHQGAEGAAELKKFLFIQQNIATEFVSDIETLMRRGLDPEIIMQFVTAGPEASRNAIKVLLGDATGQLIQFSNDTISIMRNLRVQLARESAFIATAATNPQAAKDLTDALDMASILERFGVRATPEKIAFAMGIDVATANRIAQEFGLTLGISMDQGVQNMIAGFESLFGPGLKGAVDTAADKAQISDFDAGRIFAAAVTQSKEAARQIIESMDLPEDRKQILLELVDFLPVMAKLEDVKKRADEVGNKKPKVKAEADTDDAVRTLDALVNQMLALDGRTAHLGIDVAISNADIIRAHPEIFSFLATKSAKGNLFMPYVMPFAKGGELHAAQITRFPRLWGEPETGGEAYIPLHNGRPTGRSLHIMDRVANMFGYEMMKRSTIKRFGEGGMIGGGPSRMSSSTVVIKSSVTFTGNIAGHDEFKAIAKDVMDRRDRQVAISISRKG